MNISSSSWAKIIAFLVVGVLFGGVMVLYSNSRFGASPHRASVDHDMGPVFDGNEHASRHLEKTFHVKKGETFVLDSDEGEVSIETWDKDEVSVDVEISGTDRRVERFDVQFSQKENEVAVVGRTEDNRWFRWHMGDIEVRFHVIVPKEFDVRATTAGGDMEIRDLSGNVRVETSGGNVTLASVDGPVDASTSGGNMEATKIRGNIKLETSGGTIKCEDLEGDLNAQTSGGDVILSNVDGKVEAETSGGNITLRLLGDNKGVNIRSSGGDIHIYLKESVVATLDASTSGGRVRCELPITVKGKIEDDELHGQINGGGNVIYAETSGGDIKIMELK